VSVGGGRVEESYNNMLCKLYSTTTISVVKSSSIHGRLQQKNMKQNYLTNTSSYTRIILKQILKEYQAHL